MSAGLFALSCPGCGDELEVDELGTAACAGCGHTYLSRFGHLIELDASPPPADTPPDGAR